MKSTQCKRPVIKVPTTQKDIQIEIFAVVGLLASLYMAAHYLPLLPDTIPTHFGASGRPDGWGPKSTIWLLPGIGAAFYILLTVVGRFPHIANYPVTVTEENAPRLYRLETSVIRWMKLCLVWLFMLIERGMVDVAVGKSSVLSPLLVPAMVVVTLGITVYFVVAMYRAR